MEKYMEEALIRKYFSADAYVQLSGIEITEITPKSVVVSAEIGPQHLNANGFVQGGMLYTMADFAFAVHANYLHPATVTQCGHINYIRPAKTKRLKASAKEILRSGHNTLSEVTIFDENDQVVCVCNFNGFVKDVDKETWEQMIKKEE